MDKQLSEELIKLYTRSQFGKVLKSEIDALVFHHLLKKHLKEKYLKNDRVNYFKIDKPEIYRLSVKLRMSETRFKRFLEEDYFMHKGPFDESGFLLDLVNRSSINREKLQSGTISFLLPNPVVRKYLEERMDSLGFAVNYEENREIVTMDLYPFLRLVEFVEEDEKGQIIRLNMLGKAMDSKPGPEITAFLKELNQVPLEERLKKIAKGVASKVIGKAGDEVLDMIFQGLASNP